MAIKINEIFFSIQGESSYVGSPTVFVRTSGCHLRCNYCDTKYAYHEGGMQEVSQIIETIKTYPTQYVCITGGEPLLQKEVLVLMEQLCDMNYKVSLETSGDLSCAKVDPRVLKVIDIKTPDSGEPDKFNKENLTLESKNVEFKFVICSENDFDWAEKFSTDNNLFRKNLVLYSPSYGVVDENWLAKKILSTGSSARLQLQLHKYIWSPTQRGV